MEDRKKSFPVRSPLLGLKQHISNRKRYTVCTSTRTSLMTLSIMNCRRAPFLSAVGTVFFTHFSLALHVFIKLTWFELRVQWVMCRLVPCLLLV